MSEQPLAPCAGPCDVCGRGGVTPSINYLTRQLIEQADALHDVAARAERAESALATVARLMDALPEVESDSVMMVSVRAQAIRALREATMEWRTKA